MALDLANLIADFNGAAMAIAGHAEWGFVPATWNLAIPHGLGLPAALNLANSGLANDAERTTFIKANYHHIRGSCSSNEEALCLTMMRYNLVVKGCLLDTAAARRVIVDEYTVVGDAQRNWADAMYNIPDIPAKREIAQWARRWTLTLVHMMVYVFQARGHHYKAEYDQLYDRLKASCFVDMSPGFTVPSNEKLFRLAVHCFGIYPLVERTMADKNAGDMASAMICRYTPFAPQAGVAHITTSVAVLTEMQKEQWFPHLNTKFQGQINTMHAEVANIAQNPLEYHVASRVITGNPRRAISQNAVAAFNQLSQIILGYLDHLGRNHSLRGQHAISTKAGGLGTLGNAFSKVCDTHGGPNTNVTSMAVFIQAL